MVFSWIDIFLAVLVLGFAVWGFKAGFLKTIFKLGSSIISLILSVYLYRPLADYLKTTPIFKEFVKFIFSGIYPKVEAAADKSLSVTDAYNALGMPNILFGWTTNNVPEPAKMLKLDVACNQLSVGIAGVVFDLASILIIFFAVKIIVFIIGKIITGLSKLPLIKQVDKTAGFILGIVNGLLVCYITLAIAFFVVSFSVRDSAQSVFIRDDLQKSQYAKTMYKNNFIVNFMVKK